MARARQLGRARCPVCDSTKARLAETSASRACMTCESCSLQLFARGGLSDELLRKRLIADPAPEPTPEPETKPEPTPAPAAKRRGMGLFAGLMGD